MNIGNIYALMDYLVFVGIDYFIPDVDASYLILHDVTLIVPD